MKKKILIIEDDQTISMMYRTEFEASGLEVLSADSGTEGIEIAKKEKPNLIMLDVILPRLDGFSVLKELKKEKKTKTIPVILLTNLGTTEDVEKGKKLGADDYLVKISLTPGEISNKIKTYLNK